MNGWLRGPAVQVLVMMKGLRVGDQVIVRTKHSNKGLNNKVCDVVELGEWSGTYCGSDDCTYIAAIKVVKVKGPAKTRWHSGDLGVTAEDIIAWRRP